MWEWLAAIGWGLGCLAGGIALYRKVRFFATLRGIIVTLVIGVLSGALHNFIDALFAVDEPFFFLTAIFGIGMAPVLLVQWLASRGLRLHRGWRGR